MAKKASKGPEAIAIPAPDIRILKVTVVGDSPLIVHKFSEKCKKEIEDKQQKKSKQAKPAREPIEECKAALYEIKKGVYGFPASGFKNAMVDACSFVGNFTKVAARGALYVMGDLIPIRCKKGWTMRTDNGRLPSSGTACIIYRPEFVDWECDLVIRYNANVVSAEQIMGLLATAGFSIGVGDWRPQRQGNNGMFHVKGAK